MLDNWILYSKLPFFQANIAERSIYGNLIDYINFLIFYSVKNFIYEPQWLLYTTFFFANIALILITFVKIYLKKEYSNKNLNLFIFNIFVFSLNIMAQILGIDKFATSIALGVISLFSLVYLMKSYENKLIVNFIIIFISFYSIFFAYGLEGSKYGDSRSAYYKDLKKIDQKYNQKTIPYFVSQKWSNDSWHTLVEFTKIQNDIKQKCNVKYGANLTNNTFFFVLLDYEKIQLIPFFFKETGNEFRNYFEPSLISKLQNEVNNNNIIVVTTENNDRLLKLNNYNKPIRIDLNIDSTGLNKFAYFFFPKKCA